MRTHTWKQHDTAQAWTDTLLLNAAPINLSNCTVQLLIQPEAGGTVLARAGTITDAATGRVSYQPVDADVAAVGTYLLEWEITQADGKKLTVPNDGYIRIEIIADLA